MVRGSGRCGFFAKAATGSPASASGQGVPNTALFPNLAQLDKPFAFLANTDTALYFWLTPLATTVGPLPLTVAFEALSFDPFYHEPAVFVIGNYTVTEYTIYPSPVVRAGDLVYIHYRIRSTGPRGMLCGIQPNFICAMPPPQEFCFLCLLACLDSFLPKGGGTHLIQLKMTAKE